MKSKLIPKVFPLTKMSKICRHTAKSTTKPAIKRPNPTSPMTPDWRYVDEAWQWNDSQVARFLHMVSKGLGPDEAQAWAKTPKTQRKKE